MTIWTTSAPRKIQGEEIQIRLTLRPAAYWNDEFRAWVLVSPIHIESIQHGLIEAWRPIVSVALNTPAEEAKKAYQVYANAIAKQIDAARKVDGTGYDEKIDGVAAMLEVLKSIRKG